VKPREQRKGEHTHRDDKPTGATKTKTEPQKRETSCESDDAAPYLNAKWKRRHTNDEFHVKRSQQNRKEAAENNRHPKALCLMGSTHRLKRYQRLQSSNIVISRISSAYFLRFPLLSAANAEEESAFFGRSFSQNRCFPEGREAIFPSQRR
jgi:hypothetical protein